MSDTAENTDIVITNYAVISEFLQRNMSCLMRKPTILKKAKTQTQISFAVIAKLISAFIFATREVQSLLFLNPKFQASSCLLWLYRLVCVRPVKKPDCWISLEAAQMLSSVDSIAKTRRGCDAISLSW